MRTARVAVTVVLTTGMALSPRSPQDIGRKTLRPRRQKVAQKHGVEPDLIHAIIRAESNYDSFAVSEKGAMGLMQLMPATANAYGVNNFCDPEENIEGGTKYLKDLIKLYGGKTNFVLAAYNAGQEAVKKYKGIPPYPETRNYISRDPGFVPEIHHPDPDHHLQILRREREFGPHQRSAVVCLE